MNKKHMDFICFGGEDWWYHNRGHIDMQLMRRYASKGVTLYINSIVMQKPSFNKKAGGLNGFYMKISRKLKSIFKGLKKTDAGFWVYSPFTLPVHHIPWARPINVAILRMQVWLVKRRLGIVDPVVWVACPAACDIAIKMQKIKLVYQRTDRFEEYPNVDADVIQRYDSQLKSAADITVFVNDSLYKEEWGQCKKAIYLDHGVDYEKFAMAEKNEAVPDDIASIKKPVIGYFGAISGHNTVDIELIEQVADLLPDHSFALVGKTAANYEDLASKNNVWLLGQKLYDHIPDYGKCFDVCIMPWRQNRWIAACNPIKLKEYLALGKPIVSTPFNELKKYKDVSYAATTPEGFSEAIVRALAEDCPEKILARRVRVREFSWDSKAQLVMNELFNNS